MGGLIDMGSFDEVNNNIQFYKKVVKSHQHSMLMLGLNAALTVHKVESDLMEVPMYYMGFYSQNFSSKAVLQDVKALSQVQYDLFKGIEK
jgi:archaellum component FlaF (FlaF/FlaG flagellin family)